MKERVKTFPGYKHIIKAIPVVSTVNLNNYISGYMTIEDLNKCVFMVPRIFADTKIKT